MEMEQDIPPPECPEKLSLERRVTEGLAAVQRLEKQANAHGNAAAAVWLAQARDVCRDAQRALQKHMKEHGCG